MITFQVYWCFYVFVFIEFKSLIYQCAECKHCIYPEKSVNIIAWRYVPETKGRHLEGIEYNLYEGMPPWKRKTA